MTVHQAAFAAVLLGLAQSAHALMPLQQRLLAKSFHGIDNAAINGPAYPGEPVPPQW
jgi:hypothetical protein